MTLTDLGLAPVAACAQISTLIAENQQLLAWQQLQALAAAHPDYAPIHRLQG